MELTLNSILESKIYVKENSAISFKSPHEYIQPFIDGASKLTDDFRISVSGAVKNKNEEDETINVAYGRVLVEAILPGNFDTDKGLGDTYGTIGFMYALDLQKPVIKVYSGRYARACTNLCVFGADRVFTQDLTGNLSKCFEIAQDYFDIAEKDLANSIKLITYMRDTELQGGNLDEFTGILLRRSMLNQKLGHTPIIQGTRELYNDKSIYSLKDGKTSLWNYYNSITENIKKVDILDRATKTALLTELFAPQELLLN